MADELQKMKRELAKWYKKAEKLNGEVSTLKAAYKDLKEIKEQAEKLKRRVSKTVTDGTGNWRGAHLMTFQQNGGSVVNNLDAMVHSLDAIIDDINWKINQKIDEITVIGGITRDLVTKIQNWVN